MSDNEAKVYQRFKRAVEADFCVHRIDNMAGSGTFDLTLSRGDRTIWVELKRDVHQKLRPSQLRWGMDRLAAGCFKDMWVVCPSFDDDWRIYSFAQVLQTRGVLSLVTVGLPALTGGAMRVFFKELSDG
jgi:hypothetical protein